MGKFNNLPEDIMSNIFIRLPTESVLDCKLVCQKWGELVQHPSFSKLHLKHLHSIDNLDDKFSFIFNCDEQHFYAEYDESCHENRKTKRMDLNLTSLTHSFLVGSSNGLICFGSSNTQNCGPVYICNPINREYVFLPVYERNYWWCGFGYVHSNDEYKVVRVCETRVGSNVVAVAHVYTLGSGSGWRNVGTIDINNHCISELVGVFVNEALHWVDCGGTIVLAFYLADEKFSELPAPPPYLTRDTVPYSEVTLGVLGDFVSATYCYHAGDCDIWLWKKNKDNNHYSWVKEFNFVPFACRLPRPLGFTKTGKLLYDGAYNIYSYDPKASSTIMVVSVDRFIYQTIPHKNTFVSLKLLGEKDTKTMESGKKVLQENDTKTIEAGKIASSSEETENNDKLKKPRNKVRDRVVGLFAMSVKKFKEAIQKLHLPKCC